MRANEELQMYLDCIVEVRDRVNLIQTVGPDEMTIGNEVFDNELVAMQFRKVLELIAFASLTANKAKYSAAHAKFATHWKAKLMLQELEKINSDFYPVPVHPAKRRADGIPHCDPVMDGYLTKDDFALLYDHTSGILHVRNPFAKQDPNRNVKYSTQEWVSRIRNLLSLHVVHLVNGDIWFVQVPEEGNVSVWSGSPVQPQHIP